MKLIDELGAEHVLIEQVAGSLREYARRRARGTAAVDDAPRFLEFFRLYAGQFHHAREEDTLFVALQRDAELPGDRGPIAAILDDHHRMAALLARLDALAPAPPTDAASTAECLEVALQYTEELWHHIDAENSVLFPESEQRLRRSASSPARSPRSSVRPPRARGVEPWLPPLRPRRRSPPRGTA